MFLELTISVSNAEVAEIGCPGCYRDIPDVQTGFKIPVTGDRNIDVIVIAEGYTCNDPTDRNNCEKDEFEGDAQNWYNLLFNPGIRPYNTFRNAFRVFTVFQASADHASPDRTSYYRIKVECREGEVCAIAPSSDWVNDTTDANNIYFREHFFEAIDEVEQYIQASGYDAMNQTKYPSDLSNADMAGIHRNLIVAILALGYKDSTKTDLKQLSGFVKNVKDDPANPSRIIRTAFGGGWPHEFSHAFGVLRDEYIDMRGSNAGGSNPPPGERSMFNMSNVTYSNSRCDLLWPYLAPGGRYNPNPHSLIGNLFKGGSAENGVWHSEYSCLMNGGHQNYFCNDTETDIEVDAYIRDDTHFCFRCEEIVALRIMEKTRQFGTDVPTEAVGITWYQDWDTSIRHAYFTHENVEARIAERDACYRFISADRTPCPVEYHRCDLACWDVFADPKIPEKENYRPACFEQCNIRDIGSSVFVYSGAGIFQNGSSRLPFRDISTAITVSNEQCDYPNMITIREGTYPGPMTLTGPGTLSAEGCSSTFLGQ